MVVDPFFEVFLHPGGAREALKIYRSEVVMKNLNPEWLPFTLCLEDIGGILFFYNLQRSLIGSAQELMERLKSLATTGIKTELMI